MCICLFLDCSVGLCPLGDIMLQPVLPRLNRTFIWDVKAKKAVGLQLKFSMGLTQIAPGITCSEPVTYTINSKIDENMVKIGDFCINGSISQVKVQERAILTLYLPAHSRQIASGLRIESGPAIQSKYKPQLAEVPLLNKNEFSSKGLSICYFCL